MTATSGGSPAKRFPALLSIVGPGRSGTTVLGRILGEVPGLVTIGELRWLWQRGVLERRPCGCGLPLSQCPLWSGIIAEVLGVDRPDAGRDPGAEASARQLVRAQHELDARRNRLRLIRSASGPPVPWPALERLRDAAAQVCSTLADATQSHLVVDTSKRAQDAAVLAGIGGADHYVLHIVRDPRAVAHSWRRAKPRPSAVGGTTMATRRLPGSVKRWTENSLGAEALRRYIPKARWLSTRYEDFARRPRETVQQILDFLGVEGEPPVSVDGQVLLGTSHTVAGNPDRFSTGEVRIIADEEWRLVMPRREQLLVGAATAPLLKRYGYPVVPGAARS